MNKQARTPLCIFCLLRRNFCAARDALLWFQQRKIYPVFSGTAAVHSKQPQSLSVKGTGAVFRHFMERARNAAICARVQAAVGSKRPPPTPVVMPFSTAQNTALA